MFNEFYPPENLGNDKDLWETSSAGGGVDVTAMPSDQDLLSNQFGDLEMQLVGLDGELDSQSHSRSRSGSAVDSNGNIPKPLYSTTDQDTLQ